MPLNRSSVKVSSSTSTTITTVKINGHTDKDKAKAKVKDVKAVASSVKVLELKAAPYKEEDLYKEKAVLTSTSLSFLPKSPHSYRLCPPPFPPSPTPHLSFPLSSQPLRPRHRPHPAQMGGEDRCGEGTGGGREEGGDDGEEECDWVCLHFKRREIRVF